MVTPPEFRTFTEVLGWCGKAVDTLADRLVWREFRDDSLHLNTIYRMNNADVLFDSAVLSALISSCCFEVLLTHHAELCLTLAIRN